MPIRSPLRAVAPEPVLHRTAGILILAALVTLVIMAGLVPLARGEVPAAHPEAGPQLAMPQVRAELGRWQDPAAVAVDSLLAIYRDPRDPGRLDACEQAVLLGEQGLEQGARDLAAAVGIHVYLSSAPEALRGRALVLLARGGHAEAPFRLAQILQGRADRQWLHLARTLSDELGLQPDGC